MSDSIDIDSIINETLLEARQRGLYLALRTQSPAPLEGILKDYLQAQELMVHRRYRGSDGIVAEVFERELSQVASYVIKLTSSLSEACLSQLLMEDAAAHGQHPNLPHIHQLLRVEAEGWKEPLHIIVRENLTDLHILDAEDERVYSRAMMELSWAWHPKHAGTPSGAHNFAERHPVVEDIQGVVDGLRYVLERTGCSVCDISSANLGRTHGERVAIRDFSRTEMPPGLVEAFLLRADIPALKADSITPDSVQRLDIAQPEETGFSCRL